MINPARLHSDLSRLGRETDMFLATVESLADDELAAPSLCDGWTRADVIAHIASNGRALVKLVDWATTGEEQQPYASAEARNQEIAELAALPREELVERVRESAAYFAEQSQRLTGELAVEEVHLHGKVIPATSVVALRIAEVCGLPHPAQRWRQEVDRIRTTLLAVYENHGEVLAERTAERRCFDLRPSPALSALVDRLVIQWSGFRSWARTGLSASEFPIVEIADPQDVEFPGFDSVILSYDELQDVVEEPRYSAWRTALGAVQGVYLITDISTGQLYVGKADGSENILGRWSTYARDGHGGNVALQELAGLDSRHARHFQFSLLRVFGPSVPTAEVDAAEKHFKDALLTRKYGLNRN